MQEARALVELTCLALSFTKSAATYAIGSRQLLVGLLTFIMIASCSGGPEIGAGLDQGPSSTVTNQRPDWAANFAEAGADGTFVLREAGSRTTTVFNIDRAREPRSPASTFKIFNALVLLQTGTVQGIDEVFPWDGIDRSLPTWNQDHSLRTGMEVSAVWLFQLLALRVGEAEMSRWLNEANYGNADTGGTSDQFWLDGSLRISPIGQVDFLESLIVGEHPFEPSVVQQVQQIIVREGGDGWTWSYKTGTFSTTDGPALGWLVGTTQNDGRTWLFAMNIDLESSTGAVLDPAARQQIAQAILSDAGALP